MKLNGSRSERHVNESSSLEEGKVEFREPGTRVRLTLLQPSTSTGLCDLR